MPNPNYNYRGMPNYGYPNRNENIGLLIGTLLGTGLGAASGENTGDALLRGAAGGIASYGGGMRGIQDYNTDAFKQQTIADQLLYQPKEEERAQGVYDLAREKFDWEKDQDINVNNPYINTIAQSLLKSPTSELPEQEKLPADVRTYQFIQGIKNPRERSEAKARLMPFKRPYESAEQKGEGFVMGKSFGAQHSALQKDAGSARNELNMYATLNDLMSKTDTGSLEPMKTRIAGIAQGFGVPVSEQWNANQMIDAISNKLTIMARNMGEGQMLAGQVSDSDREFLRASVPNLGLMPGANKMLIDWNMKLAQRRIDLAALADQYYDDNGTMKGFNKFRNDWINNNPLFSNTQQTGAPSPSVMQQTSTTQTDNGMQKTITATNPQTGQKIRSNDGGKTWQPLQ